MKTDNTTRRNVLQIAAAGAGAAALLAASAGGALAYQGNMERALAELQTALQSLREATPDKGGHKATAIGLIERAMSEVQAGIDFAAQHFGD
ncbi:hypothetical protein [Bradyrhizobium sp. dw_78]|uniref:hypothetical protein n=1 Tax=Bradyrhizobium sp. dw_78 TaxID=2719793 RepID=UPI001BD629D5|nr:hypothetical protein [Bradyrhizobium sp. dw_78]